MPNKAPKNADLDLDDDVADPEVDLDALNAEPDNTPSAQDGLADLELLSTLKIDRQRDDTNFRKTLLPKGDWQKIEKFQFRLLTLQNDSQPGDINPEGRTLLAFWGKPEVRVDQEGNAHQPTLNYRMSPDVRFNRDNPDKYDNSYKLWLKARRTYLDSYKADATTFAEIIQMCIDDPYVLSTMNGDDGAIVIGLKPKRR